MHTRFPRLAKILSLALVVFYVTIAIVAIVFSNTDLSDRNVLLAILILLSSVPHIALYFIHGDDASYLIIGLVGTAFGILFLANSDSFTDDQICMIWGCIDICRGLTEIIIIAPKLKNNKTELIEIAISIGDIVIGSLLIVHMLEGIRLHLIYLSIAFFISALKNVYDFFMERKENAKRSDNN